MKRNDESMAKGMEMVDVSLGGRGDGQEDEEALLGTRCA